VVRPLLLLVVALLVVAASCSGPSESARSSGATERSEPLEHVEVLTGGASIDETLPLVVALHGRGDRPERFARIFEGFAPRARVVLLRAPIVENDGLAWFTFPDEDTWGHVAREVVRMGERTIATVEAIEARHPSRGAPVVTGFSQGAMIVYSLALRHPDRFALFAPVSGVYVRNTAPTTPVTSATPPRVVALHGTRDPIIPIDADRESVEELRALGVNVELREHDAVHWIDGELQRDLQALIASAIAPTP
jgi:phospholipase/carboxylesterase